jgi:hypothetical protein
MENQEQQTNEVVINDLSEMKFSKKNFEELKKLYIEKQQEDNTLPHSDQQLLDQAWEDLTDQIAYLQEIIEMGEEADEAVERENEQFYEDEPDWGGEEQAISTTIQNVYHMGGSVYIDQEELDRLNSMEDTRDTYETDFGVYYDARDEV